MELRSFVGLALLILGCQKAPDEPAAHIARDPSVATSDVGTVTPVALSASARPVDPTAGRCVKRLPEVPPPPPVNSPAAECPKDPEGNPMLRVAKVGFPDAKPRTGGAPSVSAEVAETEKASERGLMYRKEMSEESGMLFRLSARSDHTFWMHNTCLSLDMMFIDDDGLIVGIVENAPTLSDKIQSVGCPSRYVLEVNAGWSRRHGVAPGQKVTLPPR